MVFLLSSGPSSLIIFPFPQKSVFNATGTTFTPAFFASLTPRELNSEGLKTTFLVLCGKIIMEIPFARSSIPPFITASRSFRGSVRPTIIGSLDRITSPKRGCLTRLSLTTKVTFFRGEIIHGRIIVSSVLMWLAINNTGSSCPVILPDPEILSIPEILNLPPDFSMKLNM